MTNEYEKRADDFLKSHNILFRAIYIKHGPHFDDDKKRGKERDIWRLQLIKPEMADNGHLKRLSIRFGNSEVNSDHGKTAPTPYALLSCITKSDPDCFSEFCSSFGFDDDSISAMRIYKAVKKEWEKVQQFFTEDELHELNEIW